jgi:hypothetical protein
MRQYEICYLDGEGALLGEYVATCAGEKQARIMAHAMRLPGTRRMEVWDGPALIYQRPESQRAAMIETLRPRDVLFAAE